MFSDFQCPFCAKFARDILPVLEDKYVKTGQALVAFRHLPLDMHPYAAQAAEAAECSHRQGKFWEMHDRIFAAQSQLQREAFSKFAVDIGLDLATFNICISGEAKARVQADSAQAAELGIVGTPFIFFGTIDSAGNLRAEKMISGARPIDDFQRAIESLAAK